MADAKEEDGRDKVDEMMTALARGRVALGVAAFAAPRLTVKVAGLSGGADPGRDYMVRMFGAREIAVGAGYLLSGEDSGRRMWARLGLAVDSLDLVSGLKTRKGLPIWVTAGTVAVAGGAAAVGAAKVVRDLLH
ncbi:MULTISPECIES: hypothetical protein [Actinomadura]|uniref:hypothetical protein n=1 Tax=Actinomadura TaxID=1988 RepID=UPI000405774C|nr:hypothetical protein [Actinomadura madurae]MCP9953253.1 hypothetical protein [Actinomadura madurae]MCP9970015.1 hypothetical protein [Actinomadura madurae]MCP9982476.1 hypothetical protein [Actinomadura madurae]MCQ0005995.1 hypothetical protein [Actinomadura madurae]MCQ0018718.1 hypothetical protein [Actinomadura madurae]